MRRWILIGATAALVTPAAGQDWNSAGALQLARQATERRTRAAGDSSLRDYRALGHGFLFFLGQFGEGLAEPPRLVKTDQLELEVYWKAPGRSKQRIVGWRDRTDVPTDLRYHVDHLGIVQNNFGPRIRLGDGDEVRDVPHPLAPGGGELYDFALGDTLIVALPDGDITVVELQVRPRDFSQPRLVGSLYVEPRRAELVRLVFTFTRAAYVDRQLEDLSIVLDNALYEGRWWLPYRQEIEIRRRATWLDIPARGIIRGRWEVDGYVFNVGLTDGWFAGPEIVAAPPARRDSFPWPESLEAAVREVSDPQRRLDLNEVRAEIGRLAGGRALSGVRSRRLAVSSLSDLAHVNRVEGLALGAGVAWQMGEAWDGRARLGYGFAGELVSGSVRIEAAGPRGGPAIGLYRDVRDVSDWPVGSRVVNSITSQEMGDDYGDYYSAAGARLEWRRPLGGRWEWTASAAWEWIDSLPVAAAPVRGTYRPNPDLGTGDLALVRLALRQRTGGLAERRNAALDAALESGSMNGGPWYARLSVAGQLQQPVGATSVLVRVRAGVAGDALPAHRAFVLGGRGTLVGDGFREWGGAASALGHVEWRLPVPFPTLPLGPYARTPGTLIVAPFAAAGWAERPAAGAPWRASDGARVTLGLAVEWLGLLRIEAGWGTASDKIGVVMDVTRDFWDIL